MTKLTILVVEDHEPSRAGLTELLADEGYQVAAVASGTEALANAGDLCPDVAIVDLHLPDLDGFSVVRALRERCPDCNCIVASGSSVLETDGESPRLVSYSEQALDVGAVAYLDKPIDLDGLLRLIASFDRGGD